MKLKINEVIEDVRDELLCYEEGEAVVDSWEKEFREWIEKNKGKHKDIVADKNGVFLKIKDEEEIFEIADSYLEAIAEGSVPNWVVLLCRRSSFAILKETKVSF